MVACDRAVRREDGSTAALAYCAAWQVLELQAGLDRFRAPALGFIHLSILRLNERRESYWKRPIS